MKTFAYIAWECIWLVVSPAIFLAVFVQHYAGGSEGIATLAILALICNLAFSYWNMYQLGEQIADNELKSKRALLEDARTNEEILERQNKHLIVVNQNLTRKCIYLANERDTLQRRCLLLRLPLDEQN